MEALREHIAVYRKLLAGVGVTDPVVRFTDVPPHVLELIPDAVEDAGRTQGRGYYDGMLLDITATDHEGADVGLVDGGRTDWTQRLLSNRKERLFTSGIGLSLLSRRTGRPPG